MSKHNRGNYLKIREPADLQRALARMLNQILMADNIIENSGRFASLANAWTNSFKSQLDYLEMKKLEQRLQDLEDAREVEEAREVEW